MIARPEAVTILRPGEIEPGTRPVAIEAPIAIEVDGLGYAVMMATPADLTDFAVGFALTERLVDTPRQVDVEPPFAATLAGGAGWIVRLTLAPECRGRAADRVRHRTADTACGLCGIAGLEGVWRPVAAPPPPPTAPSSAIFAALAALRDHQPLNAATGAVHAAAACDRDGAVVEAREDVGRHNALDKLIGGLARRGDAIEGFLLVSSRISFELVDKALVAAAPMLVGVSAPTSMAIDHARAHCLTLVALARRDAVLVLNDPHGLFLP